MQANGIGGVAHYIVCRGEFVDLFGFGNRQVQRIECAQRQMAKPVNQMLRTDEMRVCAGLNVERTILNVDANLIHRRAFLLRAECAFSALARKAAAQFDQRQAADRNGRMGDEISIKIVAVDLGDIALQ